tara:strand:- start:803 stop:1264 length:462 start_codon:yes stop_codon:yes gene_type:complete
MIFEKGGVELETFEEITADFIPSEYIQWREETVQLDDFEDQEILIKFVTTNLRGNNIFIDNIQINNNNSNITDYTNEIILYPNPTQGFFTINCLSCNEENIVINIKDLLGNIISQYNSKEKKLNIELSNNKNGIYFLEIENGDLKKIFPLIKI